MLPSPENVSLNTALTRWSAGDFVGCLAALDDNATRDESGEALLMRVRALLRLERAGELVDILISRADRFHGKDEIATAAMFLGAGYARQNQFDRAFAVFNRARSLRPHPTIQAETGYYHAVALYQVGAVRAARGALTRALKPSEDIIYVRALFLAGMLCAAEEKFADATAQFERALLALEHCSATDLWLRARLVHMIAVGEAESAIGDPERVLELINNVPWTQDLANEHVQALRHVGLAFQRQGHFTKAGDCFAAAVSVSPGSALAALSMAECATNALLGCEYASASMLKKFCVWLVDRVDWSGVTGEAQLGVVDAAMLAARLGDGPVAQRFMETFDACPDLNSVQGLAHDSRGRTFDRHARALVAAANGAQEHALRELREVYKAWSSIHYHWRALEARTDMVRVRPSRVLTESIEKQRALLLARTRDAVDLATPDAEPRVARRDDGAVRVQVRLSKTQRDILRLMLDDLDTREIAAHVGYSGQYVRDQFRKMYRDFRLPGKPTRAKLIAKLLRDRTLRESLVS